MPVFGFFGGNLLGLAARGSRLAARGSRLEARGSGSQARKIASRCLGVETATAQFQRVMDAILSGIKEVMVRVDDILAATSGGVPAHLEILKQVFRKLAKHNVYGLVGLSVSF